jgi:hypothetical protein
MKPDEPVPDFLVVLISLIIALLIGYLVQSIIGNWAVVLFLLILFSLLCAFARIRGWSAPFTLPLVRSPLLSELFLGLAVTISALAVSWILGTVISKVYSDMWGILAGLGIFGIIMLVSSASRNWQ